MQPPKGVCIDDCFWAFWATFWPPILAWRERQNTNFQRKIPEQPLADISWSWSFLFWKKNNLYPWLVRKENILQDIHTYEHWYILPLLIYLSHCFAKKTVVRIRWNGEIISFYALYSTMRHFLHILLAKNIICIYLQYICIYCKCIYGLLYVYT